MLANKCLAVLVLFAGLAGNFFVHPNDVPVLNIIAFVVASEYLVSPSKLAAAPYAGKIHWRSFPFLLIKSP